MAALLALGGAALLGRRRLLRRARVAAAGRPHRARDLAGDRARRPPVLGARRGRPVPGRRRAPARSCGGRRGRRRARRPLPRTRGRGDGDRRADLGGVSDRRRSRSTPRTGHVPARCSGSASRSCSPASRLSPASQRHRRQRRVAAGAGLALVAALGFGLFVVGLDAGADESAAWAVVAARATSVCVAVAGRGRPVARPLRPARGYCRCSSRRRLRHGCERARRDRRRPRARSASSPCSARCIPSSRWCSPGSCSASGSPRRSARGARSRSRAQCWSPRAEGTAPQPLKTSGRERDRAAAIRPGPLAPRSRNARRPRLDGNRRRRRADRGSRCEQRHLCGRCRLRRCVRHLPRRRNDRVCARVPRAWTARSAVHRCPGRIRARRRPARPGDLARHRQRGLRQARRDRVHRIALRSSRARADPRLPAARLTRPLPVLSEPSVRRSSARHSRPCSC